MITSRKTSLPRTPSLGMSTSLNIHYPFTRWRACFPRLLTGPILHNLVASLLQKQRPVSCETGLMPSPHPRRSLLCKRLASTRVTCRSDSECCIVHRLPQVHVQHHLNRIRCSRVHPSWHRLPRKLADASLSSFLLTFLGVE